MKVIVPKGIVAQTIGLLQAAGHQSKERMILWLGKRQDEVVLVTELIVPLQETSKVRITIPPAGMDQLFRKLQAERCMIAAQVHAHPEAAFHSYADDALALPRHEGAISLVLSAFARNTSVDTFRGDAVCYRLSSEGKWEQADISDFLELR